MGDRTSHRARRLMALVAVALIDGTLAGWAFGERRAYVVEAARVGRLLAILPSVARP